MREPQDRLTDQQLLVLRLLLVAPLLGAYFAIAVVLFLGICLESETDWIVQGYALYAAVALLVVGLPMQFVLGRMIDTRVSRDGYERAVRPRRSFLAPTERKW